MSFGGAIGTNVTAAETQLTHKGTTTANVSGNWNVAGDLSATAKNNENFTLNTDTSSAAVLDGSGGSLTTDIDEKALVTLENAKIATAGAQTVRAENASNNVSTMESAGYSFLDTVNATRLDAKASYTGDVSLKDTELTASGGDIKVSAATTGTHTTGNNLNAGSVLFDQTGADTKNNLTYQNDVRMDGASIETRPADANGTSGDVTLAAYDDTHIDDTITADSESVIAAATTAHVDTNLNRANNVTLSGNSSVVSGADAHLYTSRTEDGKLAGTSTAVTSETYNHTLIPFSNDPDIDVNFDQANVVTVDAGSSVVSVKDTTITADDGKDSQDLSSRRYTMYDSHKGSITVKENGKKNGSSTSKDSVNINGTVTAGIHDDASVRIDGNAKPKTGETREDGSTPTDFSDVHVTVEKGKGDDWLDARKFKCMETDVQNPFYAEYQSLIASQADYPASSEARKNIDAELKTLCDTMEKMGYADYKDGKCIVYKTLTMAAVEMPDITVSGGNVDISAGALAIGGAVTAKGGTAIEVINNSNISLLVNNTVIPKSGGVVYFNHAKTNKYSTQIAGLTGADHIYTADTSAAPAILIKNTGKDDKGALGHTPDILVKGNVENDAGSVTLENTVGSILTEPGANVSGASIFIKADNGDIIQVGQQEADVAGSPITQWLGDETNRKNIQKLYDWEMREKNKNKNKDKDKDKDETVTHSYQTFDDLWKNLQELCTKYNNDKSNKNKQIVLTKPTGESGAPKGIVAGGIVAISGQDVNLNGLVQSGYADYTVTLNDDAIRKIAGITSADKNLTDDAVRGNVMIKGRLVSTGAAGDSRILVASGAANIDIDTTKAANDVALGTITNRERTGTVSILDTVQNRSFDQTFTEPLANDALFPYGKDGVQRSYTWTGGVTSYTKTHYTRQDSRWLGLFTNEDFYKAYETDNDTKRVDTDAKDGKPLATQTHIKDVSCSDQNGPALTVSTQLASKEENRTKPRITSEKKYLWGVVKIYTYEWDKETTTGTATVYTMKGDNDIHVNGIAPASSGITAKASGSLLVDHNITSAKQEEPVTLLSQNGSITGNGLITTDILTAKAATGIDLKQAALGSGDSAIIDLVTDKGDVTLDSLRGNLLIKSAVAKELDDNGATVKLTSSGDIQRSSEATSPAISASRIELTAENGKIGSQGNALTIQVGKLPIKNVPESPSLNATAAGDIILTAIGKFPVDQVTSRTGDVRLIAQGGSITNASNDIVTNKTPADELVEKWKAAGIISKEDTPDSNAHAADDAKNKRLNAIEKRFEQLTLRNQETRRMAVGGNYTAEANRTSKEYKAAGEACAASEAINAARDAYIDAAQAEETSETVAAAKTAYHDAITAYFDRLKANGTTYDADEKAAITSYGETLIQKDGAYGWKENDLKNAVLSRILDKQPGDVRLPDAANITGKSITLIADGGIGTRGGKEVIAKEDLAKDLQKLRDTYPGNAVWNYDENGNLVSVTIDTSRPLYVKTTTGDTADVNLSSHGATYLGTTGQGLALHAVAGAMPTAGQVSGNMVLLAGKGITADGLQLAANDLTIFAGAGSIGTAANVLDTDIHGTLQANAKDSLYLKNAGGTTLSNKKNVTAKNTVNVSTAHGNVTFDGTTKANNVTVDAGKDATLKQNVSATNNVNVHAKDSATLNGNVNASHNVIVTTTNGDVTLDGTTTAKDITVDAGNDAILTKDVTATNNATIQAKNNANVVGTLEAMNQATVKATDKDVTLDGTVNAGSVTVDAGNNATLKKNVTAKNTVNVSTTRGNVTFDGTTKANNVTVDAGGDATLKQKVSATSNVDVHAKDNATLNGDVNASHNVIVTTTNGDVTLEGKTTAKDVSVDAGKDAIITENVTATHDVNVHAKEKATLSGDVTADNNVTVTTAHGDAVLDKQVKAKNIEVSAGGNTNVTGTTVADNDLIVEAMGGDAKLSGKAKATTATVRASQDASIDGPVIVTGVTIAAGRDANLSGAAINGKGEVDDVNIVAGRDAKIDGLANANTLSMMAKNDATITGIASVKDLMTVDAGNDANLDGLLGLHDASVHAGKDILMNVKEQTFKTTGFLSLTAGNKIDLAQAKNLEAGTDLTLKAGSDITAFDNAVSNGNGNVLASSGGTLSIKHIGNETTGSVLAIGDKVYADKVQATGNVNALSYYDMDIKDVQAGGNAWIDGVGVGNMKVEHGDVRGQAYIRSNIGGDLSVSDFHSDGMARYTTRGGNMALSNVSSDHRIGIFNYGRGNTTTVKDVTATNLISYLAFHLDIDDVRDLEAPVVFNILTAGDPARRAIGWRTAGGAHHHLLDAADAYRFHRSWGDVGTFIEYQPLTPFLGLPENASAKDIVVEEDSEAKM